MSPDTVLNIVRALLDIILALVPKEEAARELDEAAVRRANATADAAEKAKFGEPSP